MRENIAITEASEKQSSSEKLLQSEDDNQMTQEDYEEIDEALKAIKAGKWDEFVAKRPYITEYLKKKEEHEQAQLKQSRFRCR